MISANLFLAATLAAAQLTIGPETAVAPPALAKATFPQSQAATASDGEGWLVVWVSWSAGGYSPDAVVASRIAADGSPIDVAPMVIASGSARLPAVAFGAGKYLIAWAYAGTIRARTIDTDGVMSPSEVIGSVSNPMAIQAAFDGSRFLVAWSDTSDPSFVHTMQFGTILDESGVPLANFPVGDSTSADFAIAAGQGQFAIFDSLVDFSGKPNGNGYPSSVQAFRIDDAGTVTGPVTLYTAADPVFGLHAAFNGSEFMVAWSTNADLPGHALAVRWSPAGAPQPVAAFYTGGLTLTALVWTGSSYVAIVADTSEVDALSLDRDGTPLSSSNPVVRDVVAFQAATAAWNGRAVLTAANVHQNVAAKFVDASATPIDPSNAGRPALLDPQQDGIVLSLSPAEQETPAIASAGADNSLVVWFERPSLATESGHIGMVALRDGVPSMQDPILLGPAPSHDAKPAVASDGAEYLVVWQSDSGIVGQRVSIDGQPLDSAPFVVANFGFGESVAFDGQNFVVAFQTGAGCFHGARDSVGIVKVSPSGSIVPTPGVSLGSGCGEFTALAPGPSGTLLAWDGGAAFIDSFGGVSPRVMTGLSFNGAVVWTGNAFVLAWISVDQIEWDVLNSNGDVIRATHAIAAQHPYPVVVARLGVGALVSWSDASGTLNAVRLSTEGDPVGDPFPLAPSNFAVMTAAASGDASGAVVAYQRTVDVPSMPSLTRIFTRKIDIVETPRHRAVSQ